MSLLSIKKFATINNINKTYMKNQTEFEIKLPQKIKIELLNENKENMNNFKNHKDIEGEKLIDDIRIYISKKLFKWSPESKNFKFNLPYSVFKENKMINYNSYINNKKIEYKNAKIGDKLTQEQLEEIRNKGQFTVESKVEGLPYAWKISKYFSKGKENIKTSLYKDLSISYYFLYSLRNRFTTKNYQNFVCSFPSSFYAMLNGMRLIVDLFIGIPNYFEIKDIFKVESEIKRKLLLNILKENPGIIPNLYSDKYITIFHKINEEFNKIWEKESILIENEFYNKNDNDNITQNINVEEIKIKMREIRNNRYIQFINECNLIDSDYKNILNDYLSALLEYSEIELEFKRNLQNTKNQIQEELIKSHPIKSKISEWLQESVDEIFKYKKEELEKQMDNKINERLEKYKLPYLIYKSNNKLETDFQKEFLEKKNEIPKSVIGLDTVIVSRTHKNPEKKIKKDEEGKDYYYLEKGKEYKIKSTSYFWRVKLFFIRYFCYTSNVFNYCLNKSYNSGFGLKALWADKIYTDIKINKETGETSPIGETFTIKSVYRNLYKWIKDSRTDFESKPDTGFFGKKFSRIFNLIENYIFKLTICGAGLTITYPSIIITSSILNLALAVTSPVWVLGVTTLQQISNVLIYDVDSRYSFLPLFPVIRLAIWEVATKGFIQFSLTHFYTIMQPVMSLFVAFFGLTRFSLRSFYDSFMFLLIKTNGKIPQNDSEYAWRISGPGISQKYYFQINLDDALYLIHAQLEKEILFNYKNEVRNNLAEPRRILDEEITPLFKKIDLYVNNFEDNSYKYNNILNEQIEKRLKIYPNIENVKFTRNELETLKILSQEYVKVFVIKNNMNFIWSKYELPEDSFKRLTEKILCEAFGSDILETLDKADFRIEMKKTFDNSYVELKNQLFDVEKFKKFSYFVKDNNEKEFTVLPNLVTLENINQSGNVFNLSLNYLSKEDRRLIFKDE